MSPLTWHESFCTTWAHWRDTLEKAKPSRQWPHSEVTAQGWNGDNCKGHKEVFQRGKLSMFCLPRLQDYIYFSKLTKLHTWNRCALLHVNCTTIKVITKKKLHRPFLITQTDSDWQKPQSFTVRVLRETARTQAFRPTDESAAMLTESYTGN